MNSLDSLIRLALKEDIGRGDITTKTLIPPHQKAQAVIIAKQDGIIAGLPLISRVYRILDKRIRVSPKVREGSKAKKGQAIAIIRGPARAILTGERTVLNFLQRLSGIATLTNQFVQKVKKYRVKILDTRKTIPGWRVVDKYAVRVGGGINHRMGLYDAVLVKNNHLVTMLSRQERDYNVIAKVLTKLHRVRHKPIEIEVRNLRELQVALKGKPDIIMLDNMRPSQVKQAVKFRNQARPPRPLLEVSGGINLKNITQFARTGVDFVSIGTLTHSAPALDISMEVNNRIKRI